MSIDHYLSFLTRKLSRTGRFYNLTRLLRSHYAKKYANRQERFSTISDFDRDIKILVDRSTYIGGSLFWQGCHHQLELEYLRNNLKKDATFIDVGANQGEFTLFAAKYLKNGLVLAFEPEGLMFDLLEKNVKLNSFNNVLSFNFGLGSRREQQRLFTSADTQLHNGWHEGLFTAFPTEYRNHFVQEIEVRPLDEVLAEREIRQVDFIKVDVEGAELPVLQGAQKTLRQKPKLILEINEETFQAAGYTTFELVTFLNEYGYRFFRFLRGGILTEADLVEVAKKGTCFNALCQ